MENKKNLSSRVIKTELINWRELQFIQQDYFKEWDESDKHKLKSSLLSNNFAQPFYIWEDEQTAIRYCLDGKHRTDVLEEMIAEGYDVPYELPATFIQCENKKEAAKLVLIYSSIYARVSQKGMFDFIKEYDFQMQEFSNEINLPEFSMPRFEQKFDIFGTNELSDEDCIGESENPNEPVIVAQGDLFQLGNHRIYCGSFENKEGVDLLMDGEKARIVNCDPPYNMPADYIGNVEHKTHDNFAMGHGEMSDEEFRDFLAKIMQASKDNTISGAIHYIFMDFRHCWHMTEAALKVYGTIEPKQICVWKKDMMALGSFYRAQHEFCFIFKSGNDKHLSNLDLMDRIRSNVWEYPSAVSVANPDREQIQNHPTPKPVKMIADCILDTTNERDIVIDWFLGSGTTLIACEQTNRKCRATEIEPKYVQNIIKRYVRYCEKQGKTVNFAHLNGCLTINDFTKIWNG